MSNTLFVAGVDEVGRGPLAGPVIAAAVILDEQKPVDGVTDSKKLSPAQREQLALKIRQNAIAVALGRAEVEEIDEINILHASLLAMSRAVKALSRVPDKVLVDGNRLPKLAMAAEAIVKGDLHVPVIGAASIVAKVARDQEMVRWHARYPQYGFDRHKGYPTKTHLLALREFGVTPIHRRSFKPVQNSIRQ